MTHSLTSHLARSMVFRVGVLGFTSLGVLTAVPETANTIWHLNRIDRIGNSVPEVMGAPKLLTGAMPAVSFNGTGDGDSSNIPP